MRPQDLTPLEEHMFWLEVLEDHAKFVHDYLAPEEARWIAEAARYYQWFRALREKATALYASGAVYTTASPKMVEFAKEAQPAAYGYYLLEGQLQKLRLLNQINLNLTPTYFIGTLNENLEYLRLLWYYIRGEEPPELPLVELMNLWLEDQLGHALLLRNGLDPVASQMAKQAEAYAAAFNAYLLENRAIERYLRFIEQGFPEQKFMAKEVAVSVRGFYMLVLEAVERYKADELVSRLTLRFLEHHLPESCYFLTKLRMYVPEVEPIPNCSLSKPSFQ